MPAISFQPRWRKQLENGLDLIAGRPMRHPGVEPKLQTLRRPRLKARPKPGDRLRLWERQRSPERLFLGEVECLCVIPLTLSWKAAEICDACGTVRRKQICAGLPRGCDGFADAEEMLAWLFRMNGGPPLYVDLISWDPRRPWEAKP